MYSECNKKKETLGSKSKSPSTNENDVALLNNKEMLQEFKVACSLRFRHRVEYQETLKTDVHVIFPKELTWHVCSSVQKAGLNI